MPEVQFFHQERFDGGRRSGVAVDGITVLHGFIDGTGEYDSALEWYVDVAVPSTSPPAETTARAWLDGEGRAIRDALTAAADRLDCGIDSGMPWEAEIGGARVSVSAIRRLTARAIGGRLRALAAESWDVLFPAPTPAR